MESSKIDKQIDGENIRLNIKGFISESCALFAEDIKAYKQITIDFSETSFINSLGIRHWIEWMRGPKVSKEASIKLENCVPSIVSQFNMIKGFLASNCSVESVYVDYYADGGDGDKRVLLKRGVDFEPQKDQLDGWVKVSEEFSEDGQDYILDSIKEKYFAFLGKVKFK